MKGIFKLAAGEIKKLTKSYTIPIMSGILALVIGLFALIYATTDLSKGDGGISTIVSMIQGNEVVDAFDVLDTALDTFEVGGVSIDVDDATKALFKSTFSDERKVAMLKETPEKAVVAMNPATAVINKNPSLLDGFEEGNHTLFLLLTDTYIYDIMNGTLAQKGINLAEPAAAMAKIATISEADVGEAFDNVLEERQMSEKTRNGFVGDRDAAVHLVLNCFGELGREIKLEDFMFSQLYSQIIAPAGIHASIRNMFANGVEGAEKELERLEADIKYFETSGFTTGYIDIIKGMFVTLGDYWIDFRGDVESFPLGKSADQTDAEFEEQARLLYDEMLEKYYDFRAYLGEVEDYCDYSFMTPKHLLYKLNGFNVDENLSKISRFLSNVRQQNRNVLSDFYDQENAEKQLMNIAEALPEEAAEYLESLSTKYNPEERVLMRNQFRSLIGQLEGNASTSDNSNRPFYTLSTNFSTTKSTEERLEEYLAALDVSFKAVFSKGRYENVVKDSFARLDDIKAIAQKIADNDGLKAGDYARLRADYKKYTSLQKEMSKLVTASAQLEVFDAMKFRDSDVKSILGFQLLTSKYSLERDVSRATFVIKNMDSDDVYGATLGLTKGYGFMEFAFVIVSMLVLIYGIIIGAGTIAGEHSDGTMKLLLIRPYTRAQILLAKTLSTLFIVLVMLAASFLFTFLIGGIGWGFESMKVLAIFNATTPLVLNSLAVMAVEYLTMFLEIIVYVFIAITISTVFKSRAGATAIAMFIYFLTYVLNAILSSYSWYRFVIFNNTNLFMYFSTGPTLNDMTFLFSLVIDFLYLAAFVVISFFTFVKRDAT